jgi:hypothetical protein
MALPSWYVEVDTQFPHGSKILTPPQDLVSVAQLNLTRTLWPVSILVDSESQVLVGPADNRFQALPDPRLGPIGYLMPTFSHAVPEPIHCSWKR